MEGSAKRLCGVSSYVVTCSEVAVCFCSFLWLAWSGRPVRSTNTHAIGPHWANWSQSWACLTAWLCAAPVPGCSCRCVASWDGCRPAVGPTGGTLNPMIPSPCTGALLHRVIPRGMARCMPLFLSVPLTRPRGHPPTAMPEAVRHSCRLSVSWLTPVVNVHCRGPLGVRSVVARYAVGYWQSWAGGLPWCGPPETNSWREHLRLDYACRGCSHVLRLYRTWFRWRCCVYRFAGLCAAALGSLCTAHDVEEPLRVPYLPVLQLAFGWPFHRTCFNLF